MKIQDIISGRNIKLHGDGTKIGGDSQDLTQELFDTIDWSDFNNAIENKTGELVEYFKLEKSIDQFRNGTKYVNVESKNVVGLSGIFRSVFNDVRLATSSGAYFPEKKSFTLILSFMWKHIGGGSNGTELFTAWYNFDTKKWDFRYK